MGGEYTLPAFIFKCGLKDIINGVGRNRGIGDEGKGNKGLGVRDSGFGARNLAKASEWGYTGPMQITVELPKDIAQRPDPAREALEALAIEGYRSGALTSFETRRLLGFETRYELDGFLKAHNVWEHAYNVEDFNRDCETLERLEAERPPEAERPA